MEQKQRLTVVFLLGIENAFLLCYTFLKETIMKKEFSTQTCLCQALSTNYTCLRIAGQNKEENNSLVYTRNDLFGAPKKLSQVWLDKKLKDVADERNNFFKKSYEAIQMTENTESCMVGLSNSQNQLMGTFNKVFKTSKSFDECFDGFEILDKDFKELYTLFDNHAIIQTPSLNHVFGLSKLFNVFKMDNKYS